MSSAATPGDTKVHPPRNDLLQAIVWVFLGVVTVIGSWRMDRLEKQDVNPYTVPGLLPGLLGVAIVFFGILLVIRSLQRIRAATRITSEPDALPAHDRRRTWTVLALCLGFAGGLVGHGLPFWSAAAVFITITIFVLTPLSQPMLSAPRRLLKAALIGVIAGLVISIVFQEFFLVRLP